MCPQKLSSKYFSSLKANSKCLGRHRFGHWDFRYRETALWNHVSNEYTLQLKLAIHLLIQTRKHSSSTLHMSFPLIWILIMTFVLRLCELDYLHRLYNPHHCLLLAFFDNRALYSGIVVFYLNLIADQVVSSYSYNLNVLEKLFDTVFWRYRTASQAIGKRRTLVPVWFLVYRF